MASFIASVPSKRVLVHAFVPELSIGELLMQIMVLSEHRYTTTSL